MQIFIRRIGRCHCDSWQNIPVRFCGEWPLLTFKSLPSQIWNSDSDACAFLLLLYFNTAMVWSYRTWRQIPVKYIMWELRTSNLFGLSQGVLKHHKEILKRRSGENIFKMRLKLVKLYHELTSWYQKITPTVIFIKKSNLYHVHMSGSVVEGRTKGHEFNKIGPNIGPGYLYYRRGYYGVLSQEFLLIIIHIKGTLRCNGH